MCKTQTGVIYKIQRMWSVQCPKFMSWVGGAGHKPNFLHQITRFQWLVLCFIWIYQAFCCIWRIPSYYSNQWTGRCISAVSIHHSPPECNKHGMVIFLLIVQRSIKEFQQKTASQTFSQVQNLFYSWYRQKHSFKKWPTVEHISRPRPTNPLKKASALTLYYLTESILTWLHTGSKCRLKKFERIPGSTPLSDFKLKGLEFFFDRCHTMHQVSWKLVQ